MLFGVTVEIILRYFLVDILRGRAKSSRCLYSLMPKPRPKITRARPTKEVSVMAWIEDAEQKVLLVRQAVGLRLWTLPGGEVKRGESLVKALRRELYEETGLRAQIGSLLILQVPVHTDSPSVGGTSRERASAGAGCRRVNGKQY